MTTHLPHWTTRWGVALLVAFLMLAPSASAEEDEPLGYQGAYWGFEAHAGMLAPLKIERGETPGPTYGFSYRLALFASLLDIQAKVMGGHYTLRNADDDPTRIDRLSVGIETHGHPFLILILRREPLTQWLAGLYISLGLDLDFTHSGSGRWDTDPGFKMGLGSDIPLTDTDVGWALWLGVNYHVKLSGTDIPGLGALDEHILLITFGYRNNDIYFTRMPRPDEVRYKEQPLDDR